MHAIVARSTFRSQKCKALTGSEYFWTFRCRFAWQAQGIMHLVKSEQNMRVLQHFHKRWQAWDIWRGSAKMHFPWQAQYKRHVHQSCLGGQGADFLRRVAFGAWDLQFWADDFAWQVQHFVWSGITFSWQVQYFRQVEWKNCKTHWYEAVRSALNFSFLKEVSQNCFVFDVVNFEKMRKSRRIVSFLTLSSQKIRKSRRIAAFCKKWGSLPE